MLASPILAAWLLAIPVATCFQLTAPTSGSPLNLSASSIPIEWTGNDQGYSQVDLSWGGQSASGNSFLYSLVENISIPEGQYTWDPRNVSNALRVTPVTLTTGNDYHFEARLHDAGSSGGSTFTFDDYAVTGYQYTSAASASRSHLGVVLLATSLIAFQA